jgi:Na+/H+ antiporter NhaD/arsenite permease-like protein
VRMRRFFPRPVVLGLTLAIVCLALAPSAVAASPEATDVEGQHESIGERLPLWSVLPFVGILLSIALFPLLAPHFWHRHFGKVAAMWAVIFAVPFLWIYGSDAWHEIVHIYLIDYVPFIILLWSLFTISGGIVVRGTLAGTPGVNTAFLAIGTLLASWMGTTGAAMLLIRPVLRANAHRRHKVHVIVFFIFLVANIGGSLTPLGDPPLLLGFIHGVPFFWTLRLLPAMAMMAIPLLLIFFLLDRRFYRRELAETDDHAPPAEEGVEHEPLRVDGLFNLIFLAGVLAAVLQSGMWKPGAVTVLGVHLEFQNLARDAGILLMGALSLWFTPRQLRRDNGFGWAPIQEVAYLFAGIFMTIIPALALLRAGEGGGLGLVVRAVREPDHYFWVAGGLSSFLDNAPTYLTFFNQQLGRFYPGMPEAAAVPQLVTEQVDYLRALSAGAVFMGANTYIGNAPNFMVRSMAEEAGVAMPSFFGFLFRWAVPVLVPLFVLVTLFLI